MYYKKSDYTFIQFQKSGRSDKKYEAVLQNKKTARIVYIHFGAINYENYGDKTGLNLYPHLIHGDKERRRLFRLRMKHNLKVGYYSPAFFAYYYLW